MTPPPPGPSRPASSEGVPKFPPPPTSISEATGKIAEAADKLKVAQKAGQVDSAGRIISKEANATADRAVEERQPPVTEDREPARALVEVLADAQEAAAHHRAPTGGFNPDTFGSPSVSDAATSESAMQSAPAPESTAEEAPAPAESIAPAASEATGAATAVTPAAPTESGDAERDNENDRIAEEATNPADSAAPASTEEATLNAPAAKAAEDVAPAGEAATTPASLEPTAQTPVQSTHTEASPISPDGVSRDAEAAPPMTELDNESREPGEPPDTGSAGSTKTPQSAPGMTPPTQRPTVDLPKIADADIDARLKAEASAAKRTDPDGYRHHQQELAAEAQIESADKVVKELEAKQAKGSLSEKENQRLNTAKDHLTAAQAEKARIRRDTEFALQREKIAKDTQPGSPERIAQEQALAEKERKQWTKDAEAVSIPLATERARRDALRNELIDRLGKKGAVKAILDSTATNDEQKDVAIQKLLEDATEKEDFQYGSLWKRYSESRRAADVLPKGMVYDAARRQLDAHLQAGLITQAQFDAGMKQLAKDHGQDKIAADATRRLYEGSSYLQGRRMVDRLEAEMYNSKKFFPEQFENRPWDGDERHNPLSSDERALFGNNKLTYEAYQRAKHDLPIVRAKAEDVAHSEYIKNTGHDKDGNKIQGGPKEIAKRAANAFREHDKETGSFKKTWKQVQMEFNKFFGKEPMIESRKEAWGLFQRMKSEYGLAKSIGGLLAPGIFFKKGTVDREQVDNYRKLIGKNILKYAGRRVLRWFMLLLGLGAVVYLIQPFVYGKMIDTMQPFIGGGN